MEEQKIIKGLIIDPKIFSFSFGCKCNGECCEYGVYTDLKEKEFIDSIKDEIIPLMDETQNTDPIAWFEDQEEDEDFDSGIAVGTEVHNKKCVFLDKNGLCVLQRLAVQKGEHKWKYKPKYCVLFPLTIFEGALTIDDDHIDRLNYCNKSCSNYATIFDYCKEELVYLLDEDGYNELKEYKIQLDIKNSGVEIDKR